MSDKRKPLSESDYQKIADHINHDGHAIAVEALERAMASPEIAIGILGVAVDIVLERTDGGHRGELLRNFLDSFEQS